MRLSAFVVGLALLGLVERVSAQTESDIDEAYRNAEQGLKAFGAGRYSEALDVYSRAYGIVRLPALAVHIARANVKLGRFVAALRFYDEAMRLGDGVGDARVQTRARGEARAERDALWPRVPRLVFRVSGVAPSSVQVQVDGVAIPVDAYETGWLVDPGSHHYVARLGTEQRAQWVSLYEAEVHEVRLAFAVPVPAANKADSVELAAPEAARQAPTLTRRLAWASMGVGGVGMLVWGTAGIVALKKSSQLESLNCGGSQPPCPPNEVAEYDRWKTAATVGFYTGAVALLTSATLFIAEPKPKKSRESAARVVPWLGVAAAGIEGQF